MKGKKKVRKGRKYERHVKKRNEEIDRQKIVIEHKVMETCGKV
jgi:hypothetical protein